MRNYISRPLHTCMARPALEKLLSRHTNNKKKCADIMDAMLFVTRWRRRNHMTSYRKTGRPLEDIYSEDAASPSPAVPSAASPCKRKRSPSSTVNQTPSPPSSVSRTPSPSLSESSQTTVSYGTPTSSVSGYSTPEENLIEDYTPGTSPPPRKQSRRRKYNRESVCRELSRSLEFKVKLEPGL